MSEGYNPKAIEPKWQQRWREANLFRTGEDPSKPKCYVLNSSPIHRAMGCRWGTVATMCPPMCWHAICA
jgi:leucyl-tRNA synthetase